MRIVMIDILRAYKTNSYLYKLLLQVTRLPL